jgi:putative addiction module component (TIGR02574 family)
MGSGKPIVLSKTTPNGLDHVLRRLRRFLGKDVGDDDRIGIYPIDDPERRSRIIDPQLATTTVSRPESRRAYTDDMSTDLLEEALRLSARDRLQLIEALWDTLSEEDIPVAPEERVLLDARLVDLEANPDDQSPWPEVKARLEKRRR